MLVLYLSDYTSQTILATDNLYVHNCFVGIIMIFNVIYAIVEYNLRFTRASLKNTQLSYIDNENVASGLFTLI